MRIAVVTNAYPPEAKGGAGVVAADLVELWRASGHEVRVWNAGAGWLRASVVRRLLGHLIDDRRPSPFVPEIVAWKPKIIVTHNLTSCGWSTGKALQRAGARWIHVLHDVQLFEPSGRMAVNRVTGWQRMWSWYRRSLFGVPDVVVSPTEWLLEAHRRRGWFKVGVTKVLPNPAPQAKRDVSSMPRDGWVFVANELTSAKGMDLVMALARVLPEERFSCLGKYDEPLTQIIPRNIRLLGSKTREDVQMFMRHAYGVLVPSRIVDNQPTVILEAFTQGTPVVGSSVGGVPETVGSGGVVCSLDPYAWQQAMHELKQDHDAWSVRARERAAVHAPERVRQLWAAVFAVFES